MRLYLIFAVIFASVVTNEVAVAQDKDPIMARYEAGDGPNARNAWELTASTGDFNSQVMLGMLYSGAIDPKGVEVDFEKARYWMRQAVAQREKSDSFDLATVLFGYGCQLETGQKENVVGPVGMGEVIEWYKLAAEAGSGGAGLRLAQIYENGRDEIRVDMVAALDWYEWAARVSPTAIEAAASIHFKEGRIDRALYWLDHAWALSQRGVENVWGNDPYENEKGDNFAKAADRWRDTTYRSFFPACFPGWRSHGIHHKMHTTSVGDVEVQRSGNEIRYPIGFFAACAEEETGATVMMWVQLHSKNLAAKWRGLIDEINDMEYMQRERLWINGKYLEEVNGFTAASTARRDEDDNLITSFDVVLDDDIVVTSELYGSLGEDFENREAARKYLRALDFQKIINGTHGHGVFQVAEDGAIVKP